MYDCHVHLAKARALGEDGAAAKRRKQNTTAILLAGVEVGIFDIRVDFRKSGYEGSEDALQ